MAMPIAKRCMVYDFSYDIAMSIDALISQLQEDKEKLTAEGWTDLSIEMDVMPDFGEEAPPARAYLWGTRMETDQEAEDRAARDAHFTQVRARYAELALLGKSTNLVIMDKEVGN